MNDSDFQNLKTLMPDYLINSVGVQMPNGKDILDTIQIMGPIGTVIAVPDADCPKGLTWALTMKTWLRDPLYGTFCVTPGSNGVARLN